MKKIAISGNIGTGKSHVCKKLRERGFFCIDCDEIAKRVRIEKHDEILRCFQVSDTHQLGAIVFNNEMEKKKLEALLYPRIIEIMLTEMHVYEGDVFVEVPLLFEKKWEHYFDECWLVYANKEVAIQRLLVNRNMSIDQIHSIIDNQMDIEEKVAKADFVIMNSGDEDVMTQINERMNHNVT